MKVWNCLVVDDEPLAREILEQYIRDTPGLNLAGSCMHTKEAWSFLSEQSIDLLFLDIQMPGLNGMEFFRSLQHPPLVIFSTAFSEYALEAFEAHAVDYLLKPVRYDRFLKAVQRARERAGETSHTQAQQKEEDHFFIRQGTKLVKLSFDDMIYVEALKDFCHIYLQDKKVLVGMHLKELEEQLPSARFLRVHRSYIVSIDKIQAIHGNMIER